MQDLRIVILIGLALEALHNGPHLSNLHISIFAAVLCCCSTHVFSHRKRVQQLSLFLCQVPCGFIMFMFRDDKALGKERV